MEIREAIIEILGSSGPWPIEDLVNQVKDLTNFQKGVNYPYYVQKFLDQWSTEGKLVIQDGLIQINLETFPKPLSWNQDHN